MTLKFDNVQKDGALEIERIDNGISFLIYNYGEEEIGRSVILPVKELDNLIKYLQSFNQYQ